MASHPGYDPNQLDQTGAQLANDKDAPLVDRAAQGTYPVGDAADAFLLAAGAPVHPSQNDIVDLFRRMGFYTTPDLQMPVARAAEPGTVQNLRISPLQMALATAALSNGGVRPAPRIALAVNTPQQGWVVLPALSRSTEALLPSNADNAALKLIAPTNTYWQWAAKVGSPQEADSWYIAGTLPDWKAAPLALAVLIEGSYPQDAEHIGQQLIQAATRP